MRRAKAKSKRRYREYDEEEDKRMKGRSACGKRKETRNERREKSATRSERMSELKEGKKEEEESAWRRSRKNKSGVRAKREAAERKEREEALQRKVDDAVARLFDTCCEWNVGSLKSHLKEVETLSNARAVNIRQPGSDGAAACGQTLLHTHAFGAARAATLKLIRNTFLLELLERGADPSLRDAFHRTVFQACADVGDLAMVRLLLNRRDALQKSLKPGHRRLAQLAISTQTEIIGGQRFITPRIRAKQKS